MNLAHDEKQIIITVQYFVDNHNSLPHQIEGYPVTLKLADNHSPPKYIFTLQEFIDFQYHYEVHAEHKEELSRIPYVFNSIPDIDGICLCVTRCSSSQPVAFNGIPISVRRFEVRVGCLHPTRTSPRKKIQKHE